MQQRMVDSILAYDGHAIACMRAKTEWSMDADERGRTTPRRIGLAPQQRDMIEYEFTLMLDIDVDHRASISKTRCELLTDRTFSADEAQEAAQLFQGWLRSGEPMVDRNMRDRLQQMIADLPVESRRALSDVWKMSGLPKVALLTTEQAVVAISLIEQVSVPDEAEVGDLPDTDELRIGLS